MITKNISNRRENLHGNRQPNNWDLNDVVSVQPRYHLHWRMIYCTSYYFFDVRIKYIETLIMIITKNMRFYFVFFPQFCSNFSMKWFINKILLPCLSTKVCALYFFPTNLKSDDNICYWNKVTTKASIKDCVWQCLKRMLDLKGGPIK